MFWISRGYKMEECVNSRKTDVSCGNTILALLFKIGQECEDSGWIKINQIESRDWLIPLPGKKPQQQDNAVAVAMDGVGTGSLQPGKVVCEVVADCCAE
jgi:hypothetical protein